MPETAPTRRRLRWLLPALLVVGWLALSGVAGPYSGKLSEVQSNDQSEFLPGSAESQRVAELSAGFSDSDSFPAFLLVESDSALTQDQLAAFGEFAQSVPGIDVADGRTVGDFLVPGPIPVIPSDDGRAALALVSFDAGELSAQLPDGESPITVAVQQIRDAEPDLAGATVYVAGPPPPPPTWSARSAASTAPCCWWPGSPSWSSCWWSTGRRCCPSSCCSPPGSP